MKTEYYTNSKDYINRWVVSYADFITMLLALFMVMWAVSNMETHKGTEINQTLQKTFNAENVKISQEKAINDINNKNGAKTILDGGTGILSQNEIIEKIKQDAPSISDNNIIKDKRGVIIRLNNKMFFDEGSAIIKSESTKTLDEIAKSIKEMNMPVAVEGHTDSLPISTMQYSSNWELSTKRATNIVSMLIKKYKISPKKLSAVGYGEYIPIAENTNAEGRLQNRRVDIIILSNSK